MKLPNPIQSLLRPKQPHEVFLSLVLTSDGVASAAWHIDDSGFPKTIGFSKVEMDNDSWEDRVTAADSAIALVEEKIDEKTQIHKAVLGLPAEYLTENGDINPQVRSHIKKLTQALDLAAIGFVSLPQALVYKLKKTEGMPPSVILLGLHKNKIVLSVYKVGSLVGQQSIDYGDALATSVEQTLKHFKELEVLPSRIILYGMSDIRVEDAKTELLSYPWPTKANFLHFPKIDHISVNEIAESVSLAGASEIATTVTLDTEEVEIVNPEDLGFQKHDILEEVPKKKFALPVNFPKMTFPSLSNLRSRLPPLSFQKNGIFFAFSTILLIIIFAIFLWIVPRATVTILVIPQVLQSTLSVSVDPAATVADSQNKIIPGHTRADTLSGEKTIAVTGTKKIGDPAKGGVTIYNKSTTSKMFKKGTILTASGLNFTLDSDVQIASASESIGSITFGKTTSTITAAEIGPEGNLPGGTEFIFKDVGSSIAIARNDQPILGGTSREVTVVSRSDYDELVSLLTEELLSQAKQQLAATSSGSEKLIDATLKTSVTEKTFTQELDQEAKELNGKITIAVSGVWYSDKDFITLFGDTTKDKLQTGYTSVPERIETNVKSVQVKKDGKITLTATMGGIALPLLDNDAIRKSIAGNNLIKAQNYLKTIPGVGGAEFRFRWSMLPRRLPMNRNNISVTIAIQE